MNDYTIFVTKKHIHISKTPSFRLSTSITSLLAEFLNSGLNSVISKCIPCYAGSVHLQITGGIVLLLSTCSSAQFATCAPISRPELLEVDVI